ncbi:MAG: PDZ domain-containing protein [Gracilibacteraceae bacterium]|jgi:carboxyl-terminal processing protease|nr:PDZ domain-containing protein [Gracilibacteraceae bacterium]
MYKAVKRICWALVFLLAFALFPAAVVRAADADLLEEVRELLMIYYVDELGPDVLNAKSVEEMVSRLRDPDTEYMDGETYSRFVGSIDNESATGMVGVVIEEAPEGLLVLEVMEGYSAKAQGISPGDVIIAVNDAPLSGMTTDESTALLRGEPGSDVNVAVRRGQETLRFTLTRSILYMPLAEGLLIDEHIGYVALNSFGMTMAEEFQAEALRLKAEGADCWLLDLRGNTGGYTEEALDLLGFFIGNSTAMIMEESQTSESISANRQEIALSEPVVLLTDRYSASSSEVVSGALRDHRRALLVGGNTSGAGKVKQIFGLSNGDYLKMTIYRFFSPQHGAIDSVGIAPQLAVPDDEALNVGALLLAGHDTVPPDVDGYIRVQTPAGRYAFSLEDLRSETFWLAGRIILSLERDVRLERGTAAGWEYLPAGLHSHLLYYPGYRSAGILNDVPPDKVFTLSAGEQSVDWMTVTPERVELIDAQTGRRLPYTVKESETGMLELRPGEQLIPGADYWLVLHGLKDMSGRLLPPELAVIRASVEK